MKSAPNFFNRQVLIKNKLHALKSPDYNILNELLFRP